MLFKSRGNYYSLIWVYASNYLPTSIQKTQRLSLIFKTSKKVAIFTILGSLAGVYLFFYEMLFFAGEMGILDKQPTKKLLWIGFFLCKSIYFL